MNNRLCHSTRSPGGWHRCERPIGHRGRHKRGNVTWLTRLERRRLRARDHQAKLKGSLECHVKGCSCKTSVRKSPLGRVKSPEPQASTRANLGALPCFNRETRENLIRFLSDAEDMFRCQEFPVLADRAETWRHYFEAETTSEFLAAPPFSVVLVRVQLPEEALVSELVTYDRINGVAHWKIESPTMGGMVEVVYYPGGKSA